MVTETIRSHEQIAALQTRFEERMLVNLAYLESVREARKSYALLRPLIDSKKSWVCPELELLSVVAALALELHKLEDHVLPPLMATEVKLEGRVLEALLLMKNSAVALSHLKKNLKRTPGGSLEDHQIPAEVERLSIMLTDTANLVLKGSRTIVWLQEQRIKGLAQMVADLLEVPVCFDYDSDSDSDSE